MLVRESQRRQQWRAAIAPRDSVVLKDYARRHLAECTLEALSAKDVDRVCLLVEGGADPTSETRGGVFPLLAAVFRRSVPSIRRLLAAGADVDANNSRGMTALMWAVKRDDYAIVDALLEEGADVSVEGRTGWTAMSIAARHGRIEIAQLLVDSVRRDEVSGDWNANRVLNHRSALMRGLTPLMIAAIHRNEALVRYLMRLGADPGVTCHQDKTAAKHATQAGWPALGVWLQGTRAFGSNGIYKLADMQAERSLRTAGARMLDAIKSGATVKDGVEQSEVETKTYAPRENPAPVACRVASDARPRRFDLLCDITSMQMEQQRLETPLTVKVLREGQAAPDTETDSGHTALISAAYRGMATGVRLLMQEGADPNYRNRNDRTALMAAAAAGHRPVVLMLLKEEADPEILDIEGKSAGAYAFGGGYSELAELIALAARCGSKGALEWEKSRVGEEAEGHCGRRTETLPRKLAFAGDVEFPEADSDDWMIRVTRKAVRHAELRKAALSISREPSAGTQSNLIKDGAGSSPRPGYPSRGRRCPMCTLPVPCLHFSSVENLASEFPDGVPQWRWNKRKMGRSKRIFAGGKKETNEGAGIPGRIDCDIDWWKQLHRAYRQRALQPIPANPAPGSGV